MKYDELIRQLYERDFSDMRFSVFNFIDEDGYVNEISALDNEKYGIEDFSFMIFDISDNDKNKIKLSDAATLMKYKEFKYYVEKECQKKPKLSIFIMKDIGVVIAVKLKTYDLSDFSKI